MSKALTHLSKDPVMRDIIKRVGPLRQKKNDDLYVSLLRSVVGQQLSVKAAATIWNRFLALFPEHYPSAELVLSMDAGEFRAAGLSGQKAGYVKNIAQFFMGTPLDTLKQKSLSDEELIVLLTQIKGVGRWTAEMVLMFTLGRRDILPVDDLGIQSGMITSYRIRHKDKRKLYAAMERIAERWRPYRTLACMYLWRSRDLPIPAKK